MKSNDVSIAGQKVSVHVIKAPETQIMCQLAIQITFPKFASFSQVQSKELKLEKKFCKENS